MRRVPRQLVQDGRDGCFKMSTRSKRGEGKLFRRWTMLRWNYQLIRNLKALEPWLPKVWKFPLPWLAPSWWSDNCVRQSSSAWWGPIVLIALWVPFIMGSCEEPGASEINRWKNQPLLHNSQNSHCHHYCSAATTIVIPRPRVQPRNGNLATSCCYSCCSCCGEG